ncbi:MAG: sodium ion-translocating decarboxylase subunit beta, partial [Anaerolineaceae bacterium]|nr:sodium ion-translocating decarboxylase subunit beta [Anaerolineaceae bacterium]
MDFTHVIADLSKGFAAFTWQNGVMLLLGLVLIYLAIWKEYEPVLLLPIGFGCVLANLGMSNEVGFMKVIYDAG